VDLPVATSAAAESCGARQGAPRTAKSGARAERPSDALRAASINFAYNADKQTFEIFRDLSIEVPKGKTLALFGPNGTGKTTLMRALAGLQAVNGTIVSPSRDGETATSAIGYVPQGFARSFYPWASLETNILMSLPNPFGRSRQNRDAIRDAHDALGLRLDLRRRPTQSSGGMLQQAALIRAFARRPDLLIADEPFSALDFDVASRIREGFAKAVKETGICAVIVCHDLQDILEVCDLVLAIPGRPFTTNPSLEGCYKAEVFENHWRGDRGTTVGSARANPPESPFIHAVAAALGKRNS
jgi:NitT/TauT family transport system ATP-binding protein